jgi:hypothetical protein
MVRRYKCIQAHISQSDRIPFTCPSLWKCSSPEGIVSEWVQPIGAHDAYMLGDKMLFTDGLVYESTIDDNVWSPLDNASGWVVIN